MIPKIIWQTYETSYEDLPEYMLRGVESWKILNPDWKYIYHSAKQREEFVLNNFGKEWYENFKKINIGAMQADIWRYLVMYTHGGIYADIDTLCKGPISTWLKDEHKFVVQHEEYGKGFTQFLFVAEPKHALLKNIIDLVKKNIKDLDCSIYDFVYILTGPKVFTEGINLGLGIKDDINSEKENNKINNLATSKNFGFYCYGKEDSDIFTINYVEHLGACVNWKKYGYYSWLDQQDEIRKEMGYSDS